MGPPTNGFRSFGKTPVTVPLELPWVNSGFSPVQQTLKFALYDDERIYWVDLAYSYNPWSYTWTRLTPPADKHSLNVDFAKDSTFASDPELKMLGLYDAVSAARRKKQDAEERQAAAKAEAERRKAEAKEDAETRKATLEQTQKVLESFQDDLSAAGDVKAKIRLIGTLLGSCAKTCGEILDQHSSMWSGAIEARIEISEALGRLSSRLAAQGVFESLARMDAALKESLALVKSPADSDKDAYNVLLDYYSMYAEGYSLARTPSGSLVTFNQRKERLESDIKRASAKLDVLTR